MVAARKNASQKLILALCWAVYAVACLGRYSYNANINLIMEDYGVSHAEAGLVVTCFFFAYAAGQFVNGMLVKYFNKKITFPIVMIVAASLNMLLFFKVPFAMLKYVWFINGAVQSCLWPLCVSTLGENMDSAYLSKSILLMGTTNTCGVLTIYGVSALFVKFGFYRLAFLFGAIAMTVTGIAWLLLYRPTNVVTQEKECKKETRTNKAQGILLLIFVLAIFAIINNFVKDGFNTWVPTILKEKYHMKDEISIILTLVLPMFGIAGAWISIKLHKIIRDFNLLTITLLGMGALFIAVPTFFGNIKMIYALLCFGVILCLMYAANNVITSIVPLEMRDKANSGKMAGVLNGFCYVGSTISSYGLGAITDKGGWQAVFYVLLVACAASVIVGILYFVVDRLSKHKNKQIGVKSSK